MIRILFALAIFFVLTSCVGLIQLNELAIVTAVGLERGEKPDTVKVSVQIVRPADARGQTGAPAGGTGEPIYSINAEGKTIFDAIRQLGRFSSRRVYWAHNFLIVMDQDYAKAGIHDMVDFFTRNHELRMNTWVAVSPNSPSEVISTVTGLEVVPGEAVDRLFRRNSTIVGQAPRSNMMTLEEAYLSPTTHPVLARLVLTTRGISNKKPEEQGSLKQVELSGAAAFQGGKMIGWLTPRETRGLLFFTENLDSGIEVLSCPNTKKSITAEFHDASFRVTPRYQDRRLRYDIRLKTNADVVESACETPIGEIRNELERQLEQRLAQEIESLLDKAQQRYRADFLKMGDVFRNKYPVEWRELASRWDEVFAGADMQVSVSAKVVSTVLKTAEMSVK